jgi:Uma2 family endonuclease
MPVVSTIRMTARQFLQLGEDPPGVRLELVDGEIAVSPSPIPAHSHVDTQLRILVGNYISENDLGLLFGDVDTIFGENDVRRPDLLYFSKNRCHLIGEKAMEGPPDLCVEIISPSSSTTDRIDKFQQYEAGGVLHYWVLDPRDQSIEGYTLRRGKYVVTGKGQGSDVVTLPPFDDLKIPLSVLWLKLPPRTEKRRRS